MHSIDHRTPATTEVVVSRSRALPPGPVASTAASDERVASHLVARAARRLEIVCIAATVSLLVLWLGVVAALGKLGEELASPHQWVPPVSAIAASLAVLALARSGRLAAKTLVRVGLVYEVAVSFAIACGSYLGAFEGVTAGDLTADRAGVTYVVPWTLFFTVLVPARPREALLALIASGTAVPIVYLFEVRAGAAPALAAADFFLIFVLPYLANTVFAYIAARLVHQLGVEVRRATDLGSYQLDTLLGRGGMGEVWRASHRTLARPAAIKLIRQDAVARDETRVDVAVARFEREAQIIASLQSPNTVQLYDFGTTEDGTLFYVMELLDGVDLDGLVRRFGPMPAERVVHVVRQVCASLAEAHRRGIVHRDVKPANIYLCRRGIEHDVVKVLDFGLVKQVTVDGAAADASLTHADALVGTPQYMAPEMATRDFAVDGRADLYALGCVAFWLLTGRRVFEAETVTAAILAHVQRVPAPPSAATELPVPEALDRVVLDCLAKSPAARPQSPELLAARLDAVPLTRAWTEADAARWWDAHRPSATAAAG
ncbi:MAG: serine/threonine-protein kinase [Candidatus Eiseniibacteriota bacterium]